MSLLNTKPRYFPTAVATDRGWINPISGEVLVAIGNLKTKLDAEVQPVEVPVVGTTKVEISKPEIVEVKKEIIMETKVEMPQPAPYVKREYNKKPKIIGEVVEEKFENKRQIIGEVVEHKLDK